MAANKKVTDEELVASLGSVCNESTQWHRKLSQPIYKMKGSKSRCIEEAKKHLDLKGVKLKLKRTEIYRRLKTCRLGIGRSVCRTDICPICQHWEDHIERPLEARFSAMWKLLASECKGYWDGFHQPADERYKLERPRYIKQVLEHIEQHSQQCEGCEAHAFFP